eukprot:358020-Chlamydomonas_euryale.AAC.2
MPPVPACARAHPHRRSAAACPTPSPWHRRCRSRSRLSLSRRSAQLVRRSVPSALASRLRLLACLVTKERLWGRGEGTRSLAAVLVHRLDFGRAWCDVALVDAAAQLFVAIALRAGRGAANGSFGRGRRGPEYGRPTLPTQCAARSTRRSGCRLPSPAARPACALTMAATRPLRRSYIR